MKAASMSPLKVIILFSRKAASASAVASTNARWLESEVLAWVSDYVLGGCMAPLSTTREETSLLSFSFTIH